MKTIAAIGRLTQDLIVRVDRASALRILNSQGLGGERVHFVPDIGVFGSLVNELEKSGESSWSSGGTLPNSLIAMASIAPPTVRNISFRWLGLADYSDFSGKIDPSAVIRQFGVSTYCAHSPGYRRFAVCIIDAEAGEVLAIVIYTRDELIIPSETWPVSDLVLTSVHEIELANQPLWALISQSGTVSVVIADIPSLSVLARTRLKELASSQKLKFVIGKFSDFKTLGLFVEGRPLQEFSCVEFVGTAGSSAVQIWDPMQSIIVSQDVDKEDHFHGNTLGAGDAYAGGYLFARAVGKGIQEAHIIGSVQARNVLASTTSHVGIERDLNRLWAERIDRISLVKNEGDLSQRIRMSPGLVVISCGQTGVDQIAMAKSSQLGLACYAIMPSGRRTERSDGISGPPDSWGDAYVMELGTPSFRYCTWTNSYLSDGTLIWDFHGSEGSEATRDACRVLGRPVLDVVELPEAARAKTIARWVLDHNIRVVNIAGNRESLLKPSQSERVKSEVDHALRVMAFCRVQCTDLGIETIVSRIPSEVPHRTSVQYGGLRVAIAKATNTQKLFYRFAKDVLGVPTPSLRKLAWSDQCAGLEVFFARARELPILLRDGQVDLILCGTDIFDEFHPEVRVLLNTGLEPCSMVLVGRTDRVDGEPHVCSQYPNLATRLLQNFGCCQVKVREIAGAAEAWIAMGAFDFAVDTWRTGLTAEVNGMRLIRTFYSTHLAFGASVDHKISSAQALFLEDFREWLLR